MRLYAYQYQHHQHQDSQDFQAILAEQGVQVHSFYQDTLEHRPQFSILKQHCKTTDEPQDLLIGSLTAIADDYASLQAQLEELWGLQIRVITMSIQSPDATWEPVFFATETECGTPPPLGALPLARAVRPQDWGIIGAYFQTQTRRNLIEQGHGRNRLRRLPPPGKAPYGYRRGKTSYLIDLRAAPVVKGFYENFLLYGCLRRAVRCVEKNYGKSVSPSTGKRWLTHPVYRGHLCYRQSEILSNTHPPLLMKLEAAQVDRLLRRNQRFTARAVSAPRSLSGLVHCAECGSGMTVSRINKSDREYLYLRPQHCLKRPKCSGLNYGQVLQQTITSICDRLPTAIAAIQTPTAPKQALLKTIQTKENVLAQIPTLLGTGILDEETADLRSFNLETELSQLNQQLASFPPVNLAETAQAIAIPEFWHDLTETERRFYLREFIHSILIQRQGKNWHLELQFVFDKFAQESRI